MKKFILFPLWTLMALSPNAQAQTRLTIEPDVTEFSIYADSFHFTKDATERYTIDKNCEIALERDYNYNTKLLLLNETLCSGTYHECYNKYIYVRVDSFAFLFLDFIENYQTKLYITEIRIFNTNTCSPIIHRLIEHAELAYPQVSWYGKDQPQYWNLSIFRFVIGKNDLRCFEQSIIPVQIPERCVFIYDYKTQKFRYPEN